MPYHSVAEEELLGECMANKYEFSKGESVRIKAGVFRAFVGKVEEVHKGKGTLKVIVEVFGKSQSVELTFLEVEKVAWKHISGSRGCLTRHIAIPILRHLRPGANPVH